jgi:hypothetical protein
MGILDSLKDGGQSLGTAQAAEHFDQVAQTAPRGMIAEGLAAAFRSNQTPAFGNLVGTLFSHSNGKQKAGILSHLIGSAAPGILSQLDGGALTRLQGTGEQQVRLRRSLLKLCSNWLQMPNKMIPRLWIRPARFTPSTPHW